MTAARSGGITTSCALLGLLVLAVPPALGETVSITPVKDNTLYESDDGSLSNGAGPGFYVGRTFRITGSIRRGLIAFDIAGSVPSGATIQSARLNLNMTRTLAGETPVELYRVTADWGEGSSNADPDPKDLLLGGAGVEPQPGDATWIHTFFDTNLWAEAGGDFVGEASAVTDVGFPGTYSWESDGMVGDVQSWLDDLSKNFGWILIGDESSQPTAKRFDSREALVEDSRPVLIVEYVESVSLPALSARGLAILLLVLLGGAAGLMVRLRPAGVRP